MRRAVASRFPGENVLFATSVTHLRTRDANPTGWSARRFRQRCGAAVFTNKRLVVKSGLVSPLTVVWLAVAFLIAWRWWETGSELDLFLAVGALVFILQRRLFADTLEYAQIRSATLGSVRGIVGTFPLLTLRSETESINLVTADELPVAVLGYLGITNEEAEPEDRHVSST